MTNSPDLSIVIAVIAGGRDTMTACLTALEPGVAAHRLECIVPYDARLDGVEELAKRFPWAEFVDARAQVDSDRFGDLSREHHDILRAIGLREASGRIVALLEDHARPSPDWCAAVIQAHAGPEAAIGGAVENGVDRLLCWAVYFCDFGRYQNPVPEGPSEFLSDCNVSYKRTALGSVEGQWREAFHETAVNWELRRQGQTLRLDPRMVVYQMRRGLRVPAALRERYVWGRSFAATRVAGAPWARRLTFALLAFPLPLVLTWRIVAHALRTRRHLGRLVLSLPLILVLEALWSAGECVGYVTGRTDARR